MNGRGGMNIRDGIKPGKEFRCKNTRGNSVFHI